jgi:hypothetical protein
MKAIITLADIGFTAGVIIVIFIVLAAIALVVSLWLYRWSRGPRLTRCPYCHKVIPWGITPCPNCERPLTWPGHPADEYLTAED